MKQDHNNIKNTNFDQEHIFTITLKPPRNLFQTFHVKYSVTKHYFLTQSTLAEKNTHRKSGFCLLFRRTCSSFPIKSHEVL